jgi:hypothetical protein
MLLLFILHSTRPTNPIPHAVIDLTKLSEE